MRSSIITVACTPNISRNIVAHLLSYDGGGRDQPHPIAHDQPEDAPLTRRFHASLIYSKQIMSNFSISQLPPDIDSWPKRTLQTLESFVSGELNRPSSPQTALGAADVDTAVPLASPMPHNARQLIGKTFIQRLRFAFWDQAGNPITYLAKQHPH